MRRPLRWWLYCWGVDIEDEDEGKGDGKLDHGQVRDAPVDGEYVSVYAEYTWASALTTTGEVVSWGLNNTSWSSGFPSWQGQSLEAMAVSSSSICGISADGTVICAGPTVSGDSSPPTAPEYVTVAGGSGHFCAISTSDDAHCWGISEDDDGRGTPPDGNYAYVTAAYFTCGLTIHGDLRCSGSEDYLPDSAKRGIWVHADVSDVLSRAIGWPDGELTCWSDSDDWKSISLDSGATSPPTGSYRQVSVGLFHACAITVDGEMQCWGENYFGEADPPL